MLIGVTGYAQHGKDTVANLLVKEYGFYRAGFADKLKSMALVLDPWLPGNGQPNWDPENPHYMGSGLLLRLSALVEARGWEEAKQHPEVRRFLQVLGTEGVRGHLGSDAWVEALAHTIEPILYDTTPDVWRAEFERNPFELFNGVVVPDVRFPNEEKFIRSQYGELWKVVRVNEDGSPFDNGLGLGHVSEAGVDAMSPDRTIVAADVATLEKEVRVAFQDSLGLRGVS